LPYRIFSIAYAAMNKLDWSGGQLVAFSIAYAAMNFLRNAKRSLRHFSIAYAAMNTKILTDC